MGKNPSNEEKLRLWTREKPVLTFPQVVVDKSEYFLSTQQVERAEKGYQFPSTTYLKLSPEFPEIHTGLFTGSMLAFHSQRGVYPQVVHNP